VPFTSESKEAIADYDEIRKEIKLALQEAGRRLGAFLRRRERAKGEFRRRNIFELYIEEVVEACARLKSGKLAKDKLRDQLHRMAAKRTGGARTDEILGRDGSTGPEGLPHSIIVTPEGPEGEAPVLAEATSSNGGPPEASEPEPPLPEAAPAAKKGTGPSASPAGRKAGAHERQAAPAKQGRTAVAHPRTTEKRGAAAAKRKAAATSSRKAR
jgi:DNA topoisomerase-6 subunit B